MGRGVNVDDIFFGGDNGDPYGTITSPDTVLTTVINNLKSSAWGTPNFIRVSLSMNSYTMTQNAVIWQQNTTNYATLMTRVITSIPSNLPDVYVLVTLRSDASMIDECTKGVNNCTNPEATGVPSSRANTPDSINFPDGTDDTYKALVDSFGMYNWVMFGLSNEPGGADFNANPSELAGYMSHAVSTIRSEETLRGYPYHLIVVQGTNWTANLQYYATSPITSLNDIVYEYHEYPPTTVSPLSYIYSNIPVIIGEYGPNPGPPEGATDPADWSGFYTNVENNYISNAAWDFEPYGNQPQVPDLLVNTNTDTNLTLSSWGTTVQAYLAAHPGH